VSSFDDFRKHMATFAEKLIDVHVIPYRNTQTISTAVLPQYRGEKVYMPLSVTTLTSSREVPNKDAPLVMFRTGEKDYDALKQAVARAYEVLGLTGPALVDVINTPKGYMIVEVQTRPSLREGGRFMSSLKTTGVELGHYLFSRLV
jgi:D-alanine-D-alanine ligase-like ATP-grasp enzyme